MSELYLNQDRFLDDFTFSMLVVSLHLVTEVLERRLDNQRHGDVVNDFDLNVSYQ